MWLTLGINWFELLVALQARLWIGARGLAVTHPPLLCSSKSLLACCMCILFSICNLLSCSCLSDFTSCIYLHSLLERFFFCTLFSNVPSLRLSRSCASLYYMSRTVRDSSLRTSVHCCYCCQFQKKYDVQFLFYKTFAYLNEKKTI